jgi:hypothetical protein
MKALPDKPATQEPGSTRSEQSANRSVKSVAKAAKPDEKPITEAESKPAKRPSAKPGLHKKPSAKAASVKAPDFAALRTRALEPWRPYLYGNRCASVVAVKGEPGVAEQSGQQPFFGADGPALESALAALGWGSNSWCGIVLDLPNRAALDAPSLRLLIETIDPRALLALDRRALTVMQEGFGEEVLPAALGPGQKTWLLGRALVFVDGFETALVSEDNGEAKRRVWRELKALKSELPAQ